MSQVVTLTGGGSVNLHGNATVYAGNGNDSITIHGKGSVLAGNGKDTVTIFGDGKATFGNGKSEVYVVGNGNVTAGNGQDTITTKYDGTVKAGSGNDLITIHGHADVSVGGGNDMLTLYSSGTLTEKGAGGHDTINLGTGSDTIYEQGKATVWGSFSHGHFGGATIAAGGGELKVLQSPGKTEDIAVSGKMTLMGTGTPTEFVGGTGSSVFYGESGKDTFVGGSGHDTSTAVGKHNVFDFSSGGTHIVNNFVSTDTIHVDGHSLSYLESHGDVTVKNGTTIIKFDGTTVELKGFDIHKH
jgi:Ca2+-binding RTX toxin-like protein